MCSLSPEGRDQLGQGVRRTREWGGGENGDILGAGPRGRPLLKAVTWWGRQSRDVGAAGGWVGLGHVTWEEVGGALDGVRGGGGGRVRGFGSRPAARPPLAATPWTPAFLPLASLALGRPRPRSRVGLRVCAGAAGAISPVGWAVEPESARARPWRAAVRGAVVSGRRR